MNIFTAFSRAAQGLPLTPQERAWLKLVWGAVVTAFIAAIGVVSSLLATGQFAFNQQTAIAVGVAGFVALLNALAKLISANGDPMLGAAVGALAGQIPPASMPAPVPSTASSTQPTVSRLPTAPAAGEVGLALSPIAAPALTSNTSSPFISLVAPTAQAVASGITDAIAAQTS